jgi:hypothetical protein|tara:strand:+ start:91 stop:567 length:477 start_codon:yes stop_codon:yes gene_type:complete
VDPQLGIRNARPKLIGLVASDLIRGIEEVLIKQRCYLSIPSANKPSGGEVFVHEEGVSNPMMAIDVFFESLVESLESLYEVYDPAMILRVAVEGPERTRVWGQFEDAEATSDGRVNTAKAPVGSVHRGKEAKVAWQGERSSGLLVLELECVFLTAILE